MVSQQDVMAAYEKGKKSGRASANAKHRSNRTGRRRKKYYRMKKFGSSTKQAIGRFQSKHPYLAGAAEGAAIVGIGAGIVREVTGSAQVFRMLDPIKKIPILGKIYVTLADNTSRASRRLLN